MDSRKITAIFMVSMCLLFGVYAMVQILTQGWNALTETFKYVGGALLIAGFVMPRFGFWILLISMGYLDLVKRLLVVAGTTTYFDIAIVLAFAPILMLVIFAGLVAQDVRKYRLTGDRAKLFIITCVGMIVLGSTGLLFAGTGIGGMKEAANYGAFVSLLYVVPALFDNEAKVYAMLRGVVWIFIPVALYTFWQKKYGLAGFEIEYLETGLSVESRILFGQEFRLFSTLNSSQNLSKVMAMAGALAFMVPWSKNKRGFLPKMWGVFLLIMFNLAALYSGSRTGLVMGIVALGCYGLYRFKALTIAFYIACLGFFVFLVTISDQLLQDQALNRWTGSLSRTFGVFDPDEMQRINLATFSVRLMSFNNLTDPDYWTPFGFKMAGMDPMNSEFITHDMLGKLLVAMGYIPLSILLTVFGVALWRFHQTVWKVHYLVNLKLLGISLVVCVLVGGLSSQENIGTFPVNTLIYLAAGVVIWANIATKRKLREVAEEAKAAAKPEESPVRPGFGGLGPRPTPS